MSSSRVSARRCKYARLSTFSGTGGSGTAEIDSMSANEILSANKGGMYLARSMAMGGTMR